MIRKFYMLAVLSFAFAFGFAFNSQAGFLTDCAPFHTDTVFIDQYFNPNSVHGVAVIDCPTIADGTCCFKYQLLILKWSVQLQTWVQSQNITNTSHFSCNTTNNNLDVPSATVGTGLFDVTFTVWDCNDRELGKTEEQVTF